VQAFQEDAMTDHVRLEPAKRIQIRAGGQLVADTTAGYVVHEGSLPARYYVPRADIRGELRDGQGGAACPWKGQWKHLDLLIAEQHIATAAWTYYEATPVCEPIKDFVAFYPNKVEIDVE
jgi:uncharacterized protein (DUF427 family)